MMNKRHFLRATAVAALLSLGSAAQAAPDWLPNKPVTLVVGFAAGGAADGGAHDCQEAGREHRPDRGGGQQGRRGRQYRPPVRGQGPTDGSVLLFGSIGPLTIAPHIMKVGYNPFTDLAPISGGVNFPNVLVVHKGAGVKNLAEFVAKAKKSPGSVDYASTGAGSASHLAGELFNQRAGVEMVHVPYKGGAPALQDLLGERVTSYFAAPPTALPHVETGKLIPLATTGLTRPAYMPNIPTVAEAGFPGFEALNWYAFVAPGKTPTPVLDRWNLEIVKVLKDPGVAEALKVHGLTPQPTTRAEFAAFMKKEYEQWGKVVKERKITQN
jgi:tripartite-type tricarboxylate transporter receptor subunit TctC